MKDRPVYRCEVQEIRRLKYFFEIFYSSLLLALGAKVHEYFSVMVSGHDSKYKVFKIFFPHYAKRVSCIQDCFKKTGIQFKQNK